MKSRIEHAVSWPPVSLWQAPDYESWSDLPWSAGVGLVFGVGGPVPIIIRAPMPTAIDIATNAYASLLADDFEMGSWRWHKKQLLKALKNMRDAFKADQEFRREVWRYLEGLDLLGNSQVKI